jgi:hypothetical protein
MKVPFLSSRLTERPLFLRSRHAKTARDSEHLEFERASELSFFATQNCDAGAKRQAGHDGGSNPVPPSYELYALSN